MLQFIEKPSKLFIGVIGFLIILNFSSCMAQKEIIARKTPEQISQWSDEKLCENAYRDNPTIKTELFKRDLLTEEEFNYIKIGDHQNFPRVGMRKCAIWTFTNGGKLLSRSKTLDGKVSEVWEVHKGEYVIFKFTGGHYYLITIEDDKITEVKFLK